MLRSILPLLVFPFVASSEANPIGGIRPGHGGPPAPANPPPVEPPSYYSSALPTPSSIQNHDDSQQPLNARPVDDSSPAKPSASPANLAVYYGKDSSPEDPTLAALCGDDAIDTVILSYVNGFRTTNGFPILDFGEACTTKHADDDRYAPGLATCPELGRQVQTCQTSGKKVFLSIGGPRSAISFVDAADARRAAVMLWSLFGQGGSHSPDMRPLGEAAVDGFDFAWTSTPSPSIRDFASTLRTLSNKRTNYKTCSISTTPACAAADEDDKESARDLLRDVVDVAFLPAAAEDVCEIGRMPESKLCGVQKISGGCAGPYRRLQTGKSLDEAWAAGA
ncbi:hypothetical protein MPH_08938 [Macrophomina phaseolina MS6]|uniref:GH18 domain-containing protein n=1 Tax=Macrophomina phaseolina (strain MS6) TaxID=1126212 RepID=K2RUT7_MACPH|nr:hypothetical protein MPH_08938 [Macrophomina phaseolina MS6]